MNNKTKNIVVTILFSTILISFLTINIITKDEKISLSERRKLQQFPELTIKSLLKGTFFKEFDTYTTDQFIKRDEFRKIKVNLELKFKKNYNNLYTYQDYIIEQTFPLNEKSVNNLTNKMNTLKNNLDRLQLPVQEIICEDALNFLKNTDKVYDIILVDAPCSATGTLRRHPEIIHTRGAKDIEQNAALQKKLLEAAASRIINGGIILYAVCSLSKKEGEKQILEFVSSHPEFKINPIKAETIAGQRKNEINELITNEGFIRCLPCYFEQDGGLDGFFVAQLKKVK